MIHPFNRLHQEVQRWIYNKGWGTLRLIQEDAIEAWDQSASDILISASTAGGKTEAAFLPIISTLLTEAPRSSFGAVYVGPLKALINDQFSRLEEMCRDLEIPVHRWHGDVAASQKKRARENPRGVLLITPESLEAQLMLRGSGAAAMFGSVSAVVIDELHAFLESERGRQLTSLLFRAFQGNSSPRPRRVGLSATLGDPDGALEWLAAGATVKPVHVTDRGTPRDADVRVFGVQLASKQPPSAIQSEQIADPEAQSTDAVSSPSFAQSVARHIRNEFPTGTNLVFCNSRNMVEEVADEFKQIHSSNNSRQRSLVHHGSLSRELRHDAESALKAQSESLTVFCSSTLELGIDIGHCDAVGQVGAPHSVSSLLQRMGRSGRKEGTVSKLRMFVAVYKDVTRASLSVRLQMPTLRTAALLELRREGWLDPPARHDLDVSTVIQQSLSYIRQRGGVSAEVLYGLLSACGAFPGLTPEVLIEMLRDLGNASVIAQVPGGDLILGPRGEALTSHFDFYAAFSTEEEWEVVAGQDRIGVIPASEEYVPGRFLLLGGKRWRIVAVDHSRKTLAVERARGRAPLIASSGAGEVHRRVRETMLTLLRNTKRLPELDEGADNALESARLVLPGDGIREGACIRDGDEWLLVCVGSSRGLRALQFLLRVEGINASAWPDTEFEFGLSFRNDPVNDEVRTALARVGGVRADTAQLVNRYFEDTPPPRGKFTHLCGARIRALAFASECLDFDEAGELARSLANRL